MTVGQGAQAGPGTDFGSENGGPAPLFRSVKPFDADVVRSVQNIGRSYDFVTSEHLRDVLVTPKIRRCGCSHTLWRPERSWAASWRRPDGPRRLPGRSPRRFWSVLGPPGASQDRSWGVPGASRTALGRLPRRPRSGPERPKAPDDGFFVIFRRFGTDFRRSGRDFRTIQVPASSLRKWSGESFVDLFALRSRLRRSELDGARRHLRQRFSFALTPLRTSKCT